MHVVSNNNISLRLVLFYFRQVQGSKSMEHSINLLYTWYWIQNVYERAFSVIPGKQMYTYIGFQQTMTALYAQTYPTSR